MHNLIQWLSEEFLHYLSEWEESVEAREDVDDAEKAIMLLMQYTDFVWPQDDRYF